MLPSGEHILSFNSCLSFKSGKCGSSVVRHLPLVLEVPGSIPTSGKKNFGV